LILALEEELYIEMVDNLGKTDTRTVLLHNETKANKKIILLFVEL